MPRAQDAQERPRAGRADCGPGGRAVTFRQHSPIRQMVPMAVPAFAGMTGTLLLARHFRPDDVLSRHANICQPHPRTPTESAI